MNTLVKKFTNNKNGITLMALVVTIIILLILAGISIGMLSGDNSIIKQAGNAKTQTDIAQEKEILEQATVVAMGKSKYGNIEKQYLDSELSNYSEVDSTEEVDEGIQVTFKTSRTYLVDADGNVTQIIVMPTVTIPPATAVAENTKYKDKNNDIAVIPKDFKVSDDPDDQTIETGLVVKDSKDNEWVWIPVDNVKDMYITEGAPFTLCGETGVTTSMASKSEIFNGYKRTTPGISVAPYFREPDLTTSYDNDENAQMAGFKDTLDMAKSLVNDYEEMIASVGKYGGFYVGRYELTGNLVSPTEISGTPIEFINWYNIYNACKKFTTNEIESRMVWGCQWDMVCKFISEHGDKKNITDSSTWGNYKTTKVLSSDGSSTIKASGTSNKLNTGITTFTMANKIYDIAGNYWEWTQEVGIGNARATRGGCFEDKGSTYHASRWNSNRNFESPIKTSQYVTSRPTLYIK